MLKNLEWSIPCRMKKAKKTNQRPKISLPLEYKAQISEEKSLRLRNITLPEDESSWISANAAADIAHMRNMFARHKTDASENAVTYRVTDFDGSLVDMVPTGISIATMVFTFKFSDGVQMVDMSKMVNYMTADSVRAFNVDFLGKQPIINERQFENCFQFSLRGELIPKKKRADKTIAIKLFRNRMVHITGIRTIEELLMYSLYTKTLMKTVAQIEGGAPSEAPHLILNFSINNIHASFNLGIEGREIILPTVHALIPQLVLKCDMDVQEIRYNPLSYSGLILKIAHPEIVHESDNMMDVFRVACVTIFKTGIVMINGKSLDLSRKLKMMLIRFFNENSNALVDNRPPSVK
jgi:hypothetical protein